MLILKFNFGVFWGFWRKIVQKKDWKVLWKMSPCIV
jgi:hypothetical protein